jgi:hypothetical protein
LRSKLFFTNQETWFSRKGRGRKIGWRPIEKMRWKNWKELRWMPTDTFRESILVANGTADICHDFQGFSDWGWIKKFLFLAGPTRQKGWIGIASIGEPSDGRPNVESLFSLLRIGPFFFRFEPHYLFTHDYKLMNYAFNNSHTT